MSNEPCASCVELGTCCAGEGGVVTCVLRTDGNQTVVRRLAELGIRTGARVNVGQKTPGGGRVVSVAGSQLALDRATLDCLHVETR